ncbi:islet cell autoantigen 1 [Takifugu rubripes]|uniref:islet cell autoantigen 1 n=1 Tax=Takifugu rubripes TaxID=31033 RepID=UPI0011452D92|nr:islet cell autoantigen 1 [Takifugu rubripes]
MEAGGLGYSPDLLDRLMPDQNSSVVKKFQQKYWRTKQTLIKVSGRKEDEHVVASDAELDGKLEVFHSIQRTCMELLKVTEQYQRRICNFSQEENELGVFLRAQGSRDKTRAGKIMQATGKALCFSSQQRLSLRNPLCRLYQEVETFRYRAISDTWLTVNHMEQSRTEYRGALLWMKDVSQELDPDTHKQMEKFRKVQAQVRSTKTSFDKLKNDVCQKVDLLGASRCNLLSHVLTTFQTTLLHFWEKTSHKLAAIHESFRGSHHAAFSTVQDRTDKTAKEKVKAATPEGINASETAARLVPVGDEDASDTTRDELEGEKDSLALLQEILGCSATVGGDLYPDFGDNKDATGWTLAAEEEPQDNSFLPSQLLDNSFNTDLRSSSVSDQAEMFPQCFSQQARYTSGSDQNPTKAPTTEAPGTGPMDLSAWFNLFADLDPLSNPDAVGRTDTHLHSA